MSEVNEFVFDSFLPKEFPVRFGEAKFVLCEASGETDVWYKETVLRVAKPDMATQRPTSTEGINRIDPELVGRCLYRAPRSEGDSPVGVDFVLKMGTTAVSKLAAKIKEMSGLSGEAPKDEDDLKNS